VITGAHLIIYADDPDRARVFFRDVLELSFVDAHDGWLIFSMPPAELGIHPSSRDAAAGSTHEIYLMCDDINATVADLRAKGVEFAAPIENQGFGLIARLKVPGAGELGLYEPRHPTAYDL
jgi:predicted enzyme related to lactoylglutathione lyase